MLRSCSFGAVSSPPAAHTSQRRRNERPTVLVGLVAKGKEMGSLTGSAATSLVTRNALWIPNSPVLFLEAFWSSP